MTLTNDDLNAIDERVDKKITKALEKNNKELQRAWRQDFAEILAENNKILIEGLSAYIKEHCETDELKRQLRNHDRRLLKIETRLEAS